MEKLIALVTDFGPKGQHYVAQMKGVILGINPNSKMLDISHSITPYSIIEASYILKTTYKHFPEQTIFVIVVDPGVGSSRELLILKTVSNQIFIGPNNGVFSGIFSEGVSEVINIQNDVYFNKPVSSTFHGRDIMAPVAANISKEIELNEFGPNFETKKIIRLDLEYDINYSNSTFLTTIQSIDSFGNLITNIPIDPRNRVGSINGEIRNGMHIHGLTIINNALLTVEFQENKYSGNFVTNFDSVHPKALLFLRGSSGYMEISVNQGNASMVLGIKLGNTLRIKG